MKGTRGEIVRLLRQHGECSVVELADAIGIAPAATRRHLEILAGEGVVAYRSIKQAAGRPYFAYRLSEQAREAEQSDYPRLLERIVTEMAALGPEEIAAKDGRHLLETVFGHMSEHLAADYRARVHGETIEERVRSLTEALRDEGIVERWQKLEDGYHLSTSVCPHRRAALLAEHGLCSSEARAIALLLGTEVEQVGRVVDGAPACEYLVRSSQPSAVSIQPETAGAESQMGNQAAAAQLIAES